MSLAGLRRDQLVEELKKLGEEPHPRWTSVEIRSRIVEIRPPRGKGLGVSSSSKKAEIQAACEQAGIMVTTNDTKGSMMRKLRAKHDLNNSTGSTLVGFGKHAELTYREVRDHHPDYVRWVQEVRADGGGSVQLQRFAAWLERGVDTPPVSPTLGPMPRATGSQRSASWTQVPTPSASRTTSRKSARRSEAEKTPEPTVESQEMAAQQTQLLSQLASAMQQVAAQVQSLGTRVEKMEENQSSAAAGTTASKEEPSTASSPGT